jgi:hypothetical protein
LVLFKSLFFILLGRGFFDEDAGILNYGGSRDFGHEWRASKSISKSKAGAGEAFSKFCSPQKLQNPSKRNISGMRFDVTAASTQQTCFQSGCPSRVRARNSCACLLVAPGPIQNESTS